MQRQQLPSLRVCAELCSPKDHSGIKRAEEERRRTAIANELHRARLEQQRAAERANSAVFGVDQGEHAAGGAHSLQAWPFRKNFAPCRLARLERRHPLARCRLVRRWLTRSRTRNQRPPSVLRLSKATLTKQGSTTTIAWSWRSARTSAWSEVSQPTSGSARSAAEQAASAGAPGDDAAPVRAVRAGAGALAPCE